MWPRMPSSLYFPPSSSPSLSPLSLSSPGLSLHLGRSGGGERRRRGSGAVVGTVVESNRSHGSCSTSWHIAAAPEPDELSLIQVVGITEVRSYIEGTSSANWGIQRSGSGGDRPHNNFGMFSPQTGQLATVPPKQRTPKAIARAAEAMSQLDDTAFHGGFHPGEDPRPAVHGPPRAAQPQPRR
uniref:Uncharacterized protein n=1 Tax=Oryza meridionalis TaxID=40149 RepID=A0A0E0DE44_9ORYZ